MENEKILVVDVGTSSLRGILFDRAGKAVFKSQREYELETSGDGTVEMELSVLDGHLTSVLEDAGAWLKEQNEELACITVTAQRSSVIPVDQEGNALAKAMMWQDTRAGEICSGLEKEKSRIYRICGMRPSPVFSAPKIRYIRQHNEELYRRAYKLTGFQEYVICRLSGRFATDYSIASRTCLFDIRKLDWSEELLELFDVDREKLCPLIRAGSRAGDTRDGITRLLGLNHPVPVLSAGGDQQCASLGMGCVEDGKIAANSGTGSYVIAVSDEPVSDDEMQVNCNLSAIPGKWIVEGSVLSAGKTVNWLNRLLFDGQDTAFEEMTKACRTSPAGARGMIFLPLLAGKGTPSWNPGERGIILGLGFEHTKADFGRALLEGIAGEMKECIQIISRLTGKTYDMVKVAGGMTRNDLYNQIQADMYEMPVVRSFDNEATGLGAWISAAKEIGWYESYKEAYEAASAGASETRYEPDQNNAGIYEHLYSNMRQKEAAVYYQ